MDKIQKLIIAALGLALAVIMVVGIVVSATRKDEKSDIDYDEKDFKTSVTTITTTTKPDDSQSTTTTTTTDTDDTDTTTTTPTTSDEENDSSSTSSSTTTTKKEDEPSGELEISVSDLTVLVGKTKTISVEFSDNSNKPTLTFKSGNTKIATVDKNGKVKGVALGSCKVTVSTSTGDEVTINVKVTDEYGTEAITSKTMYANGCNFRKGPGVGYSAIRVLDVNEKVTVIGKNGAWYKIVVKGTEGFVKGDFLSTTKFAENTGDSGNSGNSGNSGGNTTTPDEPTDTPDEPTEDGGTDTPDEPTEDGGTDTPDEPTEDENTENSEGNTQTEE